MTSEKEIRLITWLSVEHGDRFVARAFANASFRDALAAAAELDDADARFVATRALRAALAAAGATTEAPARV